MKNILLTSLVIFISACSQHLHKHLIHLWTRTFGGDLQEIGNSVKETYDGGFIITGSSQSFCVC